MGMGEMVTGIIAIIVGIIGLFSTSILGSFSSLGGVIFVPLIFCSGLALLGIMIFIAGAAPSSQRKIKNQEENNEAINGLKRSLEKVKRDLELTKNIRLNDIDEGYKTSLERVKRDIPPAKSIKQVDFNDDLQKSLDRYDSRDSLESSLERGRRAPEIPRDGKLDETQGQEIWKSIDIRQTLVDLEKLGELRDKGIITENEFIALKERVLKFL